MFWGGFMEQIVYITDEEREKVRKVIDAFAELYELTDVVVLDAGKYGFVKLQYYREQQGFEVMSTFTDSGKLFDALWQDWFEEQVWRAVLGTPHCYPRKNRMRSCAEKPILRIRSWRENDFLEIPFNSFCPICPSDVSVIDIHRDVRSLCDHPAISSAEQRYKVVLCSVVI